MVSRTECRWLEMRTLVWWCGVEEWGVVCASVWSARGGSVEGGACERRHGRDQCEDTDGTS